MSKGALYADKYICIMFKRQMITVYPMELEISEFNLNSKSLKVGSAFLSNQQPSLFTATVLRLFFSLFLKTGHVHKGGVLRCSLKRFSACGDRWVVTLLP